MGWLPDFPDFRDYTASHGEIEPLLAQTNVPKTAAPPAKKDLSQWCSPIEDQGQLGSCTANAAVGLYEYFERRSYGGYLDGSRLFVYKTSRNLLHWTGDSGAFIRSAMAALVLFGLPPEEYWPYDIQKFDDEPSAFCYSFGQDFKATKYLRLDPHGTTAEEVIDQIKNYIASGFPSMFGFTVYSSIAQAGTDGKIPLPAAGEKVEGGHAVVAIGYDDTLEVKNVASGAKSTGAFKIRNSWGAGWGANGYGWLPYEYVAAGLAQDWWTLINADWIATGEFSPDK
jgi:C1A family cysteine protease